jgi:hypothetical protein
MEAELNTRSRIELCKYILHVLSAAKNDPRQPGALKHYQKQLAELEAKLKEEAGTQPAPITIGLKPANLFGEVGEQQWQKVTRT